MIYQPLCSCSHLLSNIGAPGVLAVGNTIATTEPVRWYIGR